MIDMTFLFVLKIWLTMLSKGKIFSFGDDIPVGLEYKTKYDNHQFSFQLPPPLFFFSNMKKVLKRVQTSAGSSVSVWL